MKLDLLLEYFPELTVDQAAALETYARLLLDWNTRVNLVSRKDTEEALPLHILHCVAFTKVVAAPVAGTHYVDVGCGGGLPGLVLAALWPQARFTMVDSIQKKTAAVADMAQQMALENVTVQWARAEDVKQKADFVIGRAVTRIGQFQQWVRHLVQCPGANPLANGILYLTGEDQLAEARALDTFRAEYHLFDAVPHPYLNGKYLLYLSTCTPQPLHK